MEMIWASQSLWMVQRRDGVDLKYERVDRAETSVAHWPLDEERAREGGRVGRSVLRVVGRSGASLSALGIIARYVCVLCVRGCSVCVSTASSVYNESRGVRRRGEGEWFVSAVSDDGQ